ncbi:ABC-three component system protein [Lactimicrobium massiliense]|uniref:ABC-three component system protein n=1 Tax=Lactimicrobium massiliense TaxID=2161814 RepID=UPI000D551743|nr:ABC-three component system protein [Lactimicrobium massiliense]
MSDLKTEFAEFVSKLAPYYQKTKEKPESFAKRLLSSVYLEEDDNDSNELLPRTYKSYYYGDSNITKPAKIILKSPDFANFENFIETDNEDTQEYLCQVFEKECPGINKDNYPVKISNYYKALVERAGKGRRAKNPTAESVTKEADLKEKYGATLVAEENGHCPVKGCPNSLFIHSDGNSIENYEVLVIDPSLSKNKQHNLIALCPTCSRKYLLQRSADQILQMKELKKEILQNAKLQESLADEKIEDEICAVLDAIPNLTQAKDVDLNYTPVALKEKIDSQNVMLLNRAKAHVDLYFTPLNEKFKELEATRKFHYERFCTQVRFMYFKFRDQGMDQLTIYNSMVTWLKQVTNGDEYCCAIVISYFIKDCEVFDAPTK